MALAFFMFLMVSSSMTFSNAEANPQAYNRHIVVNLTGEEIGGDNEVIVNENLDGLSGNSDLEISQHINLIQGNNLLQVNGNVGSKIESEGEQPDATLQITNMSTAVTEVIGPISTEPPTTPSPTTQPPKTQHLTTQPKTTTMQPTTHPGCQVGFFEAAGSSQCYKFYGDPKRTYAAAKEKCISEGLVMAEPANPISVRKYLVETYTAPGKNAATWLAARGNGANQVWERSGRTISNTDPLWPSGLPDSRLTSGWCLTMLGTRHNLESEPNNPYSALYCTYTKHTLCEYINE